VLTYALFPQVATRSLANRGNADAFEPAPGGGEMAGEAGGEAVYTVTVEGRQYTVTVAEGGDVSGIVPIAGTSGPTLSQPAGEGEPVKAPLAGTVFKILVKPGDRVRAGQNLLI